MRCDNDIVTGGRISWALPALTTFRCILLVFELFDSFDLDNKLSFLIEKKFVQEYGIAPVHTLTLQVRVFGVTYFSETYV